MTTIVDGWQALGALDNFTEGEPVAVVAGERPVAIFRLGDEVFALHDLCTHGAARLSDGFVEDGCVECPLHQGLFDIRTGAVRCAPLTEAVRTYPIRIVDGQVQISVAVEDKRTHVG
jgi:anthranilate 1,2-dioxygenase ferredoxin subunit